MSPNAFAKPDWLTLESHTIRFRDPTNRDRRFVPLLLEDAEIPAALRQFVHVDWRNRSQAECQKLLAARRPDSNGTTPVAKTSGATPTHRGKTRPLGL